MTRAWKWGDSGSRCTPWRGGSIASSMLRIISSRSGSRSSRTTPPSLAENSSGCAGDVHDVGVAQHGPEPGLALHLLPVHRVGAAQLGQRLVRRAVDERARVGEVDRGPLGGRRHGQLVRTFGRGRPAASQSR